MGDPKTAVNNFARIEEGKPGCISFLANPKYEHYVYTTESSIILVNDTFTPTQEIKATLIKVPNAREAVAKLITIYDSMKPKKTGIDSTAYIDPTAKVGENVYLGPFVAIGPHAEVGDGCVLHPHATVGERAKIGTNTVMYSNSVVYHDCIVGNNCILHAGCVIGADGFGFEPTENGYEKIQSVDKIIGIAKKIMSYSKIPNIGHLLNYLKKLLQKTVLPLHSRWSTPQQAPQFHPEDWKCSIHSCRPMSSTLY